MRFVIAGTGRSGTKWCATTLRVAGIYCGHEQMFSPEMLFHLDGPLPRHRHFAGDASFCAVPFLSRLDSFRRVLVVRHPLACAASWIRAGGLLRGGHRPGVSYRLAHDHPDVLDADDEQEATLRYWLGWNRRGVEHADRVAPIEDLDGSELLRLCGYSEPAWEPFPLGPVNATRPGSTAELDRWPDRLPSGLVDDVRAFAVELGYSEETL